MSISVSIHDVKEVEFTKPQTLREGQPDEFSSRSIRITFSDGTSQTFELFAKKADSLAVKI